MIFSNQLKLILFLLVISSAQAFAAVKYEITVAQDGSGDFTSIQEAIDASKAFPDQRITISIKNGIYKEKVKVHAWNNRLTLKGESAEKTIITYDDYFGKINRGRNSTFHTYTLLVDADDFIAENLTIENSSGPVGQAVALHVEGDRCEFRNCRILGHQDTVYAAGEKSRHYFVNCYIEGTTDFIFGASTALFDNCVLNSKSNSYITAASTTKGKQFGFVFRNCKLTADKGVDKVYLGRPWRNYAKVVFIGCEMGVQILPEGWNNWRKTEAEKTTFYAEYNCSGPGYQPEQRAAWAHQLSKKQAKKYTPEKILSGWIPVEK